MEKIIVDHLIIGSGIAGLSVAKNLPTNSQVCIITKGKYQENSTYYAQGGIAVALKEDDTTNLHYQDTLSAGDGLCIKENVKILVEDGPARINELIQLGIQFDKEKNNFHFTKEGAHSRRRILHAKDATGKEIEQALYLSITKDKNINFLENTAIVKLLVKNNTCYGCLAVKDHKLFTIYAQNIVIATGGCGQIYAHNTNPPMTTGDGLFLAYQAGCNMQDMEFIQFHPTTLYTGDKRPISIFLISEAVRGEGAILRNNLGQRFMPNYHPLAELAPRDIVCRAIIQEMEQTHSNCVYLDLNRLQVDIAERFPTIYRRCLEAKIDITKDFIPVVPAAHYVMGGIKTNQNGQTNISNLYAVGEASSNGIHGANRLASNSLLDGLVFGYRVAQDIAAKKLSTTINTEELNSNIPYLPASNEQKAQILTAKQQIREIMWQYVGIVRNNTGLKKALKKLKTFAWISELTSLEPDIVEVQSMLQLAILITLFALNRTESRGGHFRSDYPNKNDITWQKHQIYNINSTNFTYE